MTTITTINSGDSISGSRTAINNNFTNLNNDKIETSTLDTDTTLSANSDSKIPTQKAVKAYVDAGGNPNASTTQKGIVQEATAAEVAAKTATGSTGARLFVNPSTLISTSEPGTGADGALSVTSGTTTLSFAGANILEKNYSSISISAGATLGFSNPASDGSIIILRSTGNVTIDGTIDVTLMGAQGGAVDTDGTSPFSIALYGSNTPNGKKGTAGAGGAGGISEGKFFYSSNANTLGTLFISCGGGGGGASSSNGGDGVGGRGGGGILIVCGGTFTFTGTITTAGQTGQNKSAGGGSAGMGVVKYVTLGTNSGTFTATGGAGSNTTGTSAGGGGGAASVIANGGAGANGANGTAATGLGAGGGGAGGGAGSKTGGAGGATMSLILKKI